MSDYLIESPGLARVTRAARPAAPPNTCALCGEPIVGGRVVSGHGTWRAHETCNRQRVAEIHAEAIASGTHAEKWAGTICEVCGQRATVIWHVRPCVCLDCAYAMGDAAAIKVMEKGQPHVET